jgi:multiple sugar transport system permease protein
MTSADRRPLADAGTYLVLVAAALLTLAPFALSVVTSLKSPEQFASTSPLSLPNPVTLENYTTLFDGSRVNFGSALALTAAVVVVVLIGQLVFSIMAAYAFARLEFRGRETLFWVYLGTLMVPPVVTVVPLYLMMVQLGLRNTFAGLVVPYLLGSPYAVFLLREFFRGIPSEITDAARIDGAGTWRTLVHIVVPLSRPVIATLAIITVVTHANNFLWPLIVTSGDDLQVLTTATASLQGRFNANWTLVTAATTVALLPLMAVFLAFSRRIVDSIQITGFR